MTITCRWPLTKFSVYYIKMKNKNYHAVRTFLKEKSILLTHIYTLSWLGTDTSIKSGRVKLVLWSQTYIIINLSGKRNLLHKQDKINPWYLIGHFTQKNDNADSSNRHIGGHTAFSSNCVALSMIISFFSNFLMVTVSPLKWPMVEKIWCSLAPPTLDSDILLWASLAAVPVWKLNYN